jgi:hypothetical protein
MYILSSNYFLSFNRRTVLFFNFRERLHCRIPAAVELFVRGLLAAGWRQCGVLRRLFFIFILLLVEPFLFFEPCN